MNKIFGIGLSKTGTNSLCEALKHFRITMIHYPTKDYIDDINRTDGACDLPITARYKELDKLYPGSKFIYTIRDEESWHTSVKKHFIRRPTSTLSKWGKENRELIYGSLYPDEVDFLDKYRSHASDVREYFSERYEDLLVLDVSKDNAWENLADFLGKEPPPEGTPFPFSNRSPKKLPIMDAVYPYIVNPKEWDELRYSVRSLEQNFTNLRNGILRIQYQLALLILVLVLALTKMVPLSYLLVPQEPLKPFVVISKTMLQVLLQP